MEQGKNFDFLPLDITLRIFSLLPLYRVLRLRLVCKAWNALITEFADEYLKRSKETSLGIINCSNDCNSEGMFSLEICSLQIGGGLKTSMTKTVSSSTTTSTPHRWSKNLKLFSSINGVICLIGVEDVHVCNPITSEFVTLPLCHHTFRMFYGIGFGYCPLTNQYKVIKLLKDLDGTVKTAVITAGSGNSWSIY